MRPPQSLTKFSLLLGFIAWGLGLVLEAAARRTNATGDVRSTVAMLVCGAGGATVARRRGGLWGAADAVRVGGASGWTAGVLRGVEGYMTNQEWRETVGLALGLLVCSTILAFAGALGGLAGALLANARQLTSGGRG